MKNRSVLTKPRAWLAAALLAAASVMPISAVHAVEVAWSKKTFVYDAQDKPLKEVLEDFAASQGVTAVVSKAIQDNVNVHIRARPEDALKLLSSQYGLMSYYDGTALHFYKSTEMESKLIRLTNVPPARFISSLRQLGIEHKRFPVVADTKENMVLVNGPKRYVELVEEAANTMDQQGAGGYLGKGGGSGDEEVRVFPLRFAWAQDKVVSGGGESEYTVPGVATTLRKLFGGGTVSVPGRTAGPTRMRALTQNRSIVSEVLGQVDVPPSMSDSMQQFLADQQATRQGGAGNGGGLPQIHADGRTNAVIIRDVSSRMGAYGKLIESLDKKPVLVEIEARIIDVVAQNGLSLGVSYQANSRHFQGGFEGRSLASATTGADLAPTTRLLDSSVPGALATMLIGQAGKNLIVTVNALSQDGKARVLAAPRVLTLDNVEAQLSNTETHYIKVAGNLSAELFKVTAGTRLKVTPLATADADGSRRVKMQIQVEDGAISKVTSDNIPIVQTRHVNTQALVKEGDSLLIGGLVYEQDSSVVNAVPGLSKIPVLGALFRHNEDSKLKVERLFMITPRIVEVQ
jgi:type III secretion protein C